VRQELREHIAKAPPANPITMVTLTAAVVLFVVVFIANPRGLGVRLSSAVIAAMAAPMIFELSRPAFFCLALMLLVFAVLAFVRALSLLFPEWFTRWRRSQPDPGIEQAADASELQPQAA
jgi:hypothetical protein